MKIVLSYSLKNEIKAAIIKLNSEHEAIMFTVQYSSFKSYLIFSTD